MAIGWLGTHYGDEAGLEIIEICLLFPFKCWNQRCVQLC